MAPLREWLADDCRQLETQLQSWRRTLHEQPEVGFDLLTTRAFVLARLREMGYAPRKVGRAGVAATAGGRRPGKVYLLRADMDALPINEESGEAFASRAPGRMHACGHDLHTAMLLGAAKLLREHEDEIDGTVVLMFQPAEEIGQGAKDMIDAGVLGDPPVNAAMMLHVLTGAPVDVGALVLPAADSALSSIDQFEIRLQGRGAHGAMPQLARDPINAGCHIVLALQALSSREIDPNEPFVLTFGQFVAGSAGNIIPETALLTGTIRTLSAGCRSEVKKRFEEITAATAATFGVTAQISYTDCCPVLVNDPALVDSARRALSAAFGADGFLDAQNYGHGRSRVGGSEDFAYVGEKVPVVRLLLGVGDARQGAVYGHHHPKAKFDDSVLWRGTAAYLACALGWLSENK